MINSTTELFLSDFFLIKAILGQYLDNSKALFFNLAKCFLLPKKKADELYNLIDNPVLDEVSSEKDFLQYQRVCQYTQMMGMSSNISPELDEIIKIKGNAIAGALGMHLIAESDASQNVVFNNLLAAANSGVVCALRITGILQCEGIFFRRSVISGIKNLKNAADWNDIASILTLLYYSKEGRSFNVSRLAMTALDTPFADLYYTAAAVYGIEKTTEVSEVRLLNKAFNTPALKREQYEPKYARILYSRALDLKDKEKAIFSQNKDFTSAIGDLPLKLSRSTLRQSKTSFSTPLNRVCEQDKVARALDNGDLRSISSYRPVCLCSDSRYLLDSYAKAIAEVNKSVHIENIDVGALTDYDFEPTANNIFIRSADEDRDNYYFLFLTGELSERAFDAVKSFLQSAKREKFHLNSPSVTLNLGEILPVCFCDEKNANLFRQYLDIIKLAAICTDERSLAIQDMLDAKTLLYGLSEIELAEGVTQLFESYGVDEIEKSLDEAIRANRVKNQKIILDDAALVPYFKGVGNKVIGFGGTVNENR